MSDEKTSANQLNAAQSTEPRTEAGKRNSRKNALRSEFYARELVIKAEEQPEFEALRASLRRQFTPATAMQQIGFEQIVCCCWRCRLALRLEARAMGPAVGADPKNGEENEAKGLTLYHWVGASNGNLRRGIRFLENLYTVVEKSGLINLEHDEPWKKSIIKGFGQPFYDSLMEWRPFNPCAILLQEHMDEHTRMFPPGPSDPPQPNGWTRVAPDARLRWEMVLKLIELKIQQLRDLLAMNASRQLTNAQAEVCLRYFATASHDLHRAVGWFLYLQDMKL
jgi:hypothetical protein